MADEAQQDGKVDGDENSVADKPPQDPLIVKDDIFYRISKDDESGVTEFLTKDKKLVNSLDEHGMTPLQHAAYKGNKSMCQMLFDYGADVNGGRHNNGYTALHFAALSGNAYLCQMMLQQGAHPSVTNSVNRTAAQMAAFVGNHHCVSTINSFVDFKDIEYFTTPSAPDKKPKLDIVVARSLHRLIMDVNFHPVKVAITVRKNAVLVEHIPQLYKVLEEMSEREMKKSGSASEIVSFKLHLLSFILKTLHKDTNGDVNKFDDFIKSLIRPKTGQYLCEALEVLLRRGVRDFRFIETTIMQQLVTNLTHTKVCEDPGAWSIICSVVNGQKGFRDNDPCATCGEERGAKKCSRCHYDAYCDQECQRLHWFVHKRYCKDKAREYNAKMVAAALEQQAEGTSQEQALPVDEKEKKTL
ncbi:ankyrin repeat and MYND domain-containing protein 2 [Folsomia candida]|uniref:Ankyrin repeat and MYND domain-containing protein 2 n=1 Tax=Folsomia candida TaxID=158441 RepID=A0A226E423_FOLCA|nr:ankyrin repeat and MYND domain-containing protein 2 [Folsomia candida]OXA52472.1 Ankyrin repeat and MYND domain-containing protein 2 [Folsomia candida]